MFRFVMCRYFICLLFFFFNDTATTEIYPLSLHDALPIYVDAAADLGQYRRLLVDIDVEAGLTKHDGRREAADPRSEEHTSELQSQSNLVCRLLLEKKNKQHYMTGTFLRVHEHTVTMHFHA